MNAILNMETVTNATPTPATNFAPLAQSAMLVSLTIRQWEGRKLDKSATQRVTRDSGAAANAARVTKSLVSKESLAAVSAIASKARAEFYRLTLPWGDNGVRILPAALYMEFQALFADLGAQFHAAADSFVMHWETYVDAARADLGDLFDLADYPDARTIRGKFQFPRPRIFPIPSAADFRVDIGAEFIADERRAIESSLRELTETAIQDVFARIAATVGAMAEKLTAFKPAAGGDKAQGIFRDSLVENVRELVAVMPALNITGDARLNDLAARMAEICAIDANELRIDAAARADIASKAESIAKDVSAYF